MKNLFIRLKLVFKREITPHLFKQLLFEDIGRWLFKKAKSCQRCGSTNVAGYMNRGLYCDLCYDVIKKW